MKLAIHKSNWGFSNDWEAYCIKESISYKMVNCYESNIVSQLNDCDVLLWHHHHTLAKDKVFAKQLLFALEQSGIKVFPDFNTGWHFDDKLGQKYLLEAVKAPLVPTEIFYSKEEAFIWIDTAKFPKVFKLRGGAGSTNVKLVRNKQEAKRLIKRSFGRGFKNYDKWGNLKEVFRKYRLGKQPFKDVLHSIRRLFFSTYFARIHGKIKGYALFQEFIPNNKFDIRVVTIGERAFALKRLVREGDFRASGSGFIGYKKEEIDERCVAIAFEISNKLNGQSVAYDFVFDTLNNPLIVEINYGFEHTSYFDCPGYWDKKMHFHKGKFNSAEWIIDLLVTENSKN